MNDRLYEILMKLPRKNLIHCMLEALDEMQSWNGRTKTYCITKALGGESVERDDGVYYKMPSLKKMREHTEHCPIW